MKSIKEMAEKYVEERRDLDVGHANAQFNCFDMIDAVKFGANAVLEEIEKLTNNQNWGAFPKQSHKELKELIEQLKR